MKVGSKDARWGVVDSKMLLFHRSQIGQCVNPNPTSKHKDRYPNYISGSCMFRIEIRPPGGLMHHEAEKSKNSKILFCMLILDHYY